MDNTIQVLFGTESGNAERMAKICYQLAKALKMDAQLMDMADVRLNKLAEWSKVVIVTCTRGDGEMPINVDALWRETKLLENPNFENLQYGILGLGDTSYDYFCQAAKDWDSYLASTGAKSVIPTGTADHDYYDTSIRWVINCMCFFTGKTPDEVKAALADMPDIDAEESAEDDGYNLENPWLAEIVERRELCSEGSSKSVQHIELNLAGSDIHYEPGDCIEIIPVNNAQLVDDFIAAMLWDPNEPVEVNGQSKTIRDALINDWEIRQPSRKLLNMLAEKHPSSGLADTLEKLSKEELDDFLHGHDVLSIVKAYSSPPHAKKDLKSRLAALRGDKQYYPRFHPRVLPKYMKSIQPRAYSIASSQAVNPDTVHLTIADVQYQKDQRQHTGACSSYLSHRVSKGDKVRCWLLPNKYFAVPEDANAPVIMIGPGTGIAPFVGFLQERQAQAGNGKNWLFFGDRHAKTDFLYEPELQAFQADGTLTRLDTAFSRDQAEKVYVQNKIEQAASELYQWIEDGAYIYICGDARHMARDVEAAIIKAIANSGNKTLEEAENALMDLQRNRRYVKDVY